MRRGPGRRPWEMVLPPQGATACQTSPGPSSSRSALDTSSFSPVSLQVSELPAVWELEGVEPKGETLNLGPRNLRSNGFRVALGTHTGRQNGQKVNVLQHKARGWGGGCSWAWNGQENQHRAAAHGDISWLQRTDFRDCPGPDRPLPLPLPLPQEETGLQREGKNRSEDRRSKARRCLNSGA